MPTPAQKRARRFAHEAASENARRLGLSRRAFLVSAAAYRERRNPSFATYGPKSRREFLALWDARGGVPG